MVEERQTERDRGNEDEPCDKEEEKTTEIVVPSGGGAGPSEASDLESDSDGISATLEALHSPQHYSSLAEEYFHEDSRDIF